MQMMSQSSKGKALQVRGAFRFLWVLAAICLWLAPGYAQTGKPNSAKSSSTKSVSAKSKAKKKPARRRARGQMAPSADRIAQIQAALAKSGHYSAEPTGKWDATTTAALMRFQEERGLRPTGKLNARCLQLLGLGSETFGIAPPRKPAAVDSSSQ